MAMPDCDPRIPIDEEDDESYEDPMGDENPNSEEGDD